MQREALDERRQRRALHIAGKEHRLRGSRRRIKRLEEAVELASAFVVVVLATNLNRGVALGRRRQ
jgi:hypothetical protein